MTPSANCIQPMKLAPWGLLLLLCLAAPLAGQELLQAKPGEVGLSAEKMQRIDKAMQELVDQKTIAGAVTVVARRGKVVHFGKFGMMDVEAKKTMRPDTIFRIYSMSKPITTVAAMMLHEEGKFQLDDPVSKHLPQLKGLKVYNADGEPQPPGREMSVRDLMRHSSGLTYGVFGNTPVDQMYRRAGILGRDTSLRQMVEKLGKIPLQHQPGTRWLYSVSTDVLGRLVEVLSGKSLDEFFQQRIFGPLDMKDTAFHVPAEKLDRFAANYGPAAGGGLRVIDAPANSRYLKPPALFSGGGGLVSTARDYTRFCQMLSGGGRLHGKRLLRAETLAAMTRNQLPDELMPIAFGPVKRAGVGFGLGFSVVVSRQQWDSAAVLGEYGWGGAASTHFWISPKHDLVVVALQQHMPFSFVIERKLKPLVYDAIVE